MTYSEERQYFNGYGQPYKSSKSGTRDRIEDAIVTQRAFDGRGNLAWESTPRTWAQSSGTLVATNARTSFVYDPLGRITKRTNPDGTYSTMEYAEDIFTDRNGQRTNWPTQVGRDEHCYDSGSAGTICGISRRSVDATGDVIRTYLYDNSKTDYGAGSSTARITQYSYDNLGRLVGVVDPVGATWSYSYDSYGDRTVSNDPALGRWTMQYDANGNLTRQLDAKNQPVEIAYDALDRIALKRVGSGDNRTDTRYYYDEARPGHYNKGQLTSLRVWTKQDGYYHSIYRDYGHEGQLRKETNDIGGRSYDQFFNYRKNGELDAVRVPYQSGSTRSKWLPSFQYDAANRLTGFGSYIKSVNYNLWDNPIRVNYGNGTYTEVNYHSTRGWVDRINIRNSGNSQIDYTQYSRSATGRVREQRTQMMEGRMSYQYDYAGRLLRATNTAGVTDYNQQFSYDTSGRIRYKSGTGTYKYNGNKLAPHTVEGEVGSGIESTISTRSTSGSISSNLSSSGSGGSTSGRPTSGYNVINVPASGGAVTGTSGKDLIIGGPGVDTANGLDGDDYIVDGLKHDWMTGGAGRDTFELAADNSVDYVMDFDPAEDKLDITAWGISSMDDLTIGAQPSGNSSNGWVIPKQGQGGTLVLLGLSVTQAAQISRNNFVFTGDGGDTGDGGPTSGRPTSGYNVINILESGGAVTGTSGKDLIIGGPGIDTAKGLDGDDYIVDGPNYDWMTGGTGRDTFELAADRSPDFVMDFNPAEDKLDISAWGISSLDQLTIYTQPNTTTTSIVPNPIDGGTLVLFGMNASKAAQITRENFVFTGDSGGTDDGGDTGGGGGGSGSSTSTLTYDANGNMIRSLNGKVMTYDAENRPLSVTYRGKTTKYVYGADGSRLKLIDNAGTATETITVTFGMVEIRNYGQGSKEVIITHPHPDVRFVNDKPSYLHRDQLQSVRMVTNQAGARAKRTIYKPFGEAEDWTYDLATQDESIGWIGERYDEGAGLQFLNARYYDPELGLFLQPDWFEVTQPGVGTNRYAYSFNDPINGMDPGGNVTTYTSDFDGDGRNDSVTHHSPGSDYHEAYSRGDYAYLRRHREQLAASSAGSTDSITYYVNGAGLVVGHAVHTTLYDAIRTGPGTIKAPPGPYGQVRVDHLLGLTVEGNTLSGEITFSCSGSGCQTVIDNFNSTNGTYGAYALNVRARLVSTNADAELVLTVKGPSRYRASAQTLNGERTCCTNRSVAVNTNLSYAQSTARHEYGHVLGHSHMRNRTGSIMSYGYFRNAHFTEEEVKRLVDAYR